MMVRTQIQLTQEQARRLKELAKKRGVSMAELIREGVEKVLDAPEALSLEERKRLLCLSSASYPMCQI